MWNWHLQVNLALGIAHFAFALAWLALCEKGIVDDARLRFIGYVPRVLDSFQITLFVCITGHANSFGVIVYSILVLLGSAYRKKNWGFFSMIMCVSLYFISGILIRAKVLPMANVLGYITRVTWRELIVSTLLIGLALYLTTTIVHQIAKNTRVNT